MKDERLKDGKTEDIRWKDRRFPAGLPAAVKGCALGGDTVSSSDRAVTKIEIFGENCMLKSTLDG